MPRLTLTQSTPAVHAAFEWLERAYRQHDGGLSAGVMTDPLIEGLRGDPRYRALVRKMNLRE